MLQFKGSFVNLFGIIIFVRIVYQGKTKKGLDIVVRYPEKGDGQKMREYINELSKERTFIRYQGEQETLENESKYLDSILKNIEEKRSVHLFVFYNDSLISASDIKMMDKTEKHIGVFGIAVLKEFRGQGLGKFLMDLVFEEARKNLKGLKIVTLEVYAKNSIARRIYQNFGFKEYGLLPNGIVRDENYDDAILMYKNV
jgi:ribosomal protein S18 acetylase RimI-like enzyme